MEISRTRIMKQTTTMRSSFLYYWRMMIYITDKKHMANIFNEYFINIVNDLPRPEQFQY